MEGEGRSIKLSRDDNLSVVNLSGHVHQLPCCVKYDGSCAVSDYFKPKSAGIGVDGLKVEEVHFRGRKLQGATILLPAGYSGFVLGKRSHEKRKTSDMSERDLYWEMKAKFDKLTYWNHDSLPSQDDAFARSFHWFPLAEALHKPATTEDLVKASTELKNKSQTDQVR